MSLSLVTAPTIEPVTFEEAQSHLRLTDATDAPYVNALITTAREYCENYTRRAFISQTWDLKFDGGFPDGDIELPMPPVSSITSITYVDTAGATQTWAAANYTTDLPAGPRAMPARIAPAYGVSYPSTRDQNNAVTVRFVCGYGATISTVPFGLKAAMLLLIGHWYENRASITVGPANDLPDGVAALLWPFKVF